MPQFADKSLRDATAQELQLELIRRTQHNALNGEQVVEDLLARRALWTAVILDRLYLWEVTPRRLPASNLIKLRDLADNDWNADTLYILCPDRGSAEELRALASEAWGGEPAILDNEEELSRSLGMPIEGECILRVWWD